MTVATVIYYSGYHPYTLEKMYTPRTKEEKLQQRMYLFWYKKEFQDKIKDRLKSFKRFDILKKLFPDKEVKGNADTAKRTFKPKHKKKSGYKPKYKKKR